MNDCRLWAGVIIDAAMLREEAIAKHIWHDLGCDHCGGSTMPVIVVGQEPDNDSATARLCVNCMESLTRKMKDRAQEMADFLDVLAERSK